MQTLERQEKREIRIQIGNLIESRCRVCPTKSKSLHTNEPCLNCPTFQQLRSFGDMLDDGVDEEEEFQEVMIIDDDLEIGEKLSVEGYLALKKRLYADKDIAEYFNVTIGSLYTFKSHNGLTRKRIWIDKNQYLELKERGLTDRQVAKKLSVALPTLRDWKNRNGIKTRKFKKAQ